MIRRRHTTTLLAVAGLATASVASAGWQGDFSALLSRHVKAGEVDSRGWTAARQDMRLLREVVAAIAMEAPSGTRNQRLAWYLNAYNALALSKLLDGGGREDGLRSRDLVVAGEILSLDDLERSVIGPAFHDPRIHFALVRTTIAGPPLRDRAFTAAGLEAELEAITRAFLSGKQAGVRISKDGFQVEVSPLFEWFRDDFDRGDLRAFINRYRTEPLPPLAAIRFPTGGPGHDEARRP